MLEHERPHLMAMPEPFDGYVEKPARVSSTCLVSVARNRYSVPCELARQMVSTRLYPGSLVVVADDVVVARHERMSALGGTRYDWQHYIPLVQRKSGALRNGDPFADMPEALQRLRRGLLRQVGGDRVMAQGRTGYCDRGGRIGNGEQPSIRARERGARRQRAWPAQRASNTAKR